MRPYTIGGINQLKPPEKRDYYLRLVPLALLDYFHLSPYLVDERGNDLVTLKAVPGTTTVEMEVRHRYDFQDPVLYGHLADTINGQLHVLLYVINNPDSPRFDVDRLPDGTPTNFGILHRNLAAEEGALRAGLAPGQIRSGLRLLNEAIATFEAFVTTMGHNMYFVEPLFYHNAVIFERHGFYYQSGRRRMRRIQEGFSPGGEFIPLLDGSSPFRQGKATNSVRLRSWAIHDGIMGEPLHDITMYKALDKSLKATTTAEIDW
jgi:hypothetical protein